MQDTKFDLWCMVELFGHSKIAIPATEQEMPQTLKAMLFYYFESKNVSV